MIEVVKPGLSTTVQDAASLFKSQKRLLTGRKGGPAAGATVGTTVLLLGLVSLLTDISAEITAASGQQRRPQWPVPSTR